MSLSDRIDNFPEAWKPKPGDKLVGIVTGIDERDGEYGTYPVITVMDEDTKEWAFHGFHTVARRELARQRPRVDDSIGIKYFGLDEEKGYEKYRILTEHHGVPEGPVDWEKVGAEAEAELSGDDDALPLGSA